jgi:hypothetical protein
MHDLSDPAATLLHRELHPEAIEPWVDPLRLGPVGQRPTAAGCLLLPATFVAWPLSLLLLLDTASRGPVEAVAWCRWASSWAALGTLSRLGR